MGSCKRQQKCPFWQLTVASAISFCYSGGLQEDVWGWGAKELGGWRGCCLTAQYVCCHPSSCSQRRGLREHTCHLLGTSAAASSLSSSCGGWQERRRWHGQMREGVGKPQGRERGGQGKVEGASVVAWEVRNMYFVIPAMLPCTQPGVARH